MKDTLFRIGIYFFSLVSALLLSALLVFLYIQSKPFFRAYGIVRFIFGQTWDAYDTVLSFGIFHILSATFYISALACVFGFPLAFGAALCISFYLNGFTKLFFSKLVGLLAAIPSIVYGFFGLFVIVKNIEKGFAMSAGESVLAGSIILAIMILPYFTSHITEHMERIKKRFKGDSDALGISPEYFVLKIAIPQLRLPILTGFLLAFSRALGETMAVMMVIGNTPIVPHLLSKAQTIPSLIALELGMSEAGSTHYHALFAAGFVLLLFVTIINLLIFILSKEQRNAKNPR